MSTDFADFLFEALVHAIHCGKDVVGYGFCDFGAYFLSESRKFSSESDKACIHFVTDVSFDILRLLIKCGFQFASQFRFLLFKRNAKIGSLHFGEFLFEILFEDLSKLE